MLVCALFVFLLAYAHGSQLWQVNTTEGVVVGAKARDGDYYAFYGIPYAGPTSGQNRFKAPVPPSRHSEVFYANDNGKICEQPMATGLIRVENCLILSVFTRNTTIPKPVIVWLNADEYTNTNTEVDNYRSLIEKNVTFVSINFRLSIFGFLCLGVQEAPGNAGLRDVIQGLKWIKANIANFGGDPNNVILMGHASGAAMVDLLTLSPKIENLVHKAIVLSGSALAPWAVAYDPFGYAEMLGAKLGYSGKTPEELAKHLVNAQIYELHPALAEFKFTNNTQLFAPCIENPKLNPNDTVLAEAPINILRSGRYAQIPVIYGYTTWEASMIEKEAFSEYWLLDMQIDFTRFLQVDLNFGNNKKAVAATIRDFYFGSSPINKEGFYEYEGDTLVLISVIRAARERALTSKSEVRLLEFDYLGTLDANLFNMTGAMHGAFVNYLFDYYLRPVDEPVSKSIVERFTGFAYNGTNATNLWPAITKNITNYLYYGGTGYPTANNTKIYVEEPRFDPYVQRMTFWENLYAKYYVAPTPTQPSSSSTTLSCILFVMLCQFIVRLF